METYGTKVAKYGICIQLFSLHENEFLCSLWQHKETFMFFYGAP